MREVVSISLPKAYRIKLDKLSKKSSISRSDLIRKALDQYLPQQEFLAISEKLTEQARKQSIFTDEDVFRLVS